MMVKQYPDNRDIYAIGLNPSHIMALARQECQEPDGLNAAFSRVMQEQKPTLEQTLTTLIEADANTSIVIILDTKTDPKVVVRTQGNEFLDALSQNPGFTREKIAANKLKDYLQEACELDEKFEQIKLFTANTTPMPVLGNEPDN